MPLRLAGFRIFSRLRGDDFFRSKAGPGAKLARLAALALIALAAACAALVGRYQIAINASASVVGEVMLLRLGERRQYEIGSMVAFAFDGSRWGFPADRPWAKRVAGVAGEPVRIEGGVVLVGGRTVAALHGPMMAKRRLSAASAGVIPAGHLFVTGEHERSFDSRYREFGLIPIDAVFAEVIAIM